MQRAYLVLFNRPWLDFSHTLHTVAFVGTHLIDLWRQGTLASASYTFARCIITVFVTQRIDSSVI